MSEMEAVTVTQNHVNSSICDVSDYMSVASIRKAKVAHPTGDPKFEVMQPFPSAFAAEETDPFLMCDFYDLISKGVETDPDKFPVDWHPHRGMDILSYLISGRGRHADSLGNREEYPSPGMQWMSVGSGVEHAEGGGTPAGEHHTGFQIWINVPSARKLDPPRYGTEAPENIPVVEVPCAANDNGVANEICANARVLAGELNGRVGPFKTVAKVQVIDYFDIKSNGTVLHTVVSDLDNCLIYAYRGRGVINGVHSINTHDLAQLDAQDAQSSRVFSVRAIGEEGLSIMVFSGQRLHQQIAWRGPFVMTTDHELRETISDYRRGAFPVERVAWNYKRVDAKPK